MIDIERREDCCGCNACADICPKSAISFSVDNEGFWYPVVEKKKCINCGLCDRVCPITNECRTKKVNAEKPICYASEHKNIEVVFGSTTSGMFSALADVMYNENGYVGGAVHNEDFSASQFISNDRNDLLKLRRSKDLQSNAEGFHKKVKKLLQKGEKVLVCGVPCQIAGLLNFLGKDYENLITVDLICAGVNSPKVWKKYLDYIEQLVGSKIIWTENKNKEYGWEKLTQKFVFENGEEYFDTRQISLFTKGFIESHLYCRPSCYECAFKGFPRTADISIGDFWGITKHTSSHDSDMGTNVVMLNSEKGSVYFEKVRSSLNLEQTPLEWACEGNPALTKSITKLSDKRTEFFEDLDRLRFDILVQKYEPIQISRVKKTLRPVKHLVKFALKAVKVTRLHPRAVYQTIRYSGVRNLIHRKGIFFGPHCCLNIAKSAKIQVDGLMILGYDEKFPNSHMETRLHLGKNASMNILNNFQVGPDSEIKVLQDAELTVHGTKFGYSRAESGLRITCGEKIEIKHDVDIGRHVKILDTLGEHHVSIQGHKPCRPVFIGEKTWLQEECTVLPGVQIGKSTVVGAHSVVSETLPDHVMASGFPAEIIEKDIVWQM